MKDTGTQLIRKTELTGLRPLLGAAGLVVHLYAQFQKVLNDQQLYQLFAKPVYDEKNTEIISWYSDLDGDIIPYDQLDKVEQETLIFKIRNNLEALTQRIEELGPKDKSLVMESLDNALEIPEESRIFRVGGEPVIIEWGFIREVFNARRHILKNLINSLTGTLRLSIYNHRNEPVSGTTVQMSGRTQGVFQTGSDGMVEVKLAIGDTADFKISGPNGLVMDIQIKCQQLMKEETVIFPAPKVDIGFLVTDDKMIPLKNVSLYLRNGDQQYVIQTNDSGETKTTVLSDSTVEVTINHPLHRKWFQKFPVEGQNSRYSIKLMNSQRFFRKWITIGVISGLIILAVATGLWIKLYYSSMSFQIQDKSNQTPIIGAQLQISSTDGELISSVNTDTRGLATPDWLPDGKNLKVQIQAQYYQSMEVAVTCCDTTSTINYALEPLHLIKLEIRDSQNNQPIEKAVINLKTEDSEQVTTDLVGKGSFNKMLPKQATFSVEVQHPDFRSNTFNLKCCEDFQLYLTPNSVARRVAKATPNQIAGNKEYLVKQEMEYSNTLEDYEYMLSKPQCLTQLTLTEYDGDAEEKGNVELRFIQSNGYEIIWKPYLVPSNNEEVKTHIIDIKTQYKPCLKDVKGIVIRPVEIQGTTVTRSQLGGSWQIRNLNVTFE
ncbi:MAG: hypothetical protein HQM12_17410 [SAR324 cluster bacterium]|nr:hypothetical protein [SAR324 cluster bacterium]